MSSFQFVPSAYYFPVLSGAQTPAVSLREIYEFLGVKKKFATWVSAQIRRLALRENVDFYFAVGYGGICPLEGTNPVGRPRSEYYVTVRAAKHIALASHTPRGEAVRDYFIYAEDWFRAQAGKVQPAPAQSEPLEQDARPHLQIAEPSTQPFPVRAGEIRSIRSEIDQLYGRIRALEDQERRLKDSYARDWNRLVADAPSPAELSKPARKAPSTLELVP